MNKKRVAYQSFGLKKKSSEVLVDFVSTLYVKDKKQLFLSLEKIVKDEGLKLAAKCFCCYLIGCFIGDVTASVRVKKILKSSE